MLTSKQLAQFEMWFREYFDPDVEELPNPKYLHQWAEKHGEALLAMLNAIPQVCPSCNHPKCDARCDLHFTAEELLPYISGKECPCCKFLDAS